MREFVAIALVRSKAFVGDIARFRVNARVRDRACVREKPMVRALAWFMGNTRVKCYGAG